ncbi:MAG: hypothetical protein M9894_09405 [Planctomycetes bacterium]|nr:hypothetical protein [Planctomycetota bacterium]
MTTLRALALLPLVLLAGCLDYTEEVFVQRDGSGRMRTEVAVLAEFLTDEDVAEMRQGLEEAAAALRQDPDVTKVEVADRRQGLKHAFLLDVSTRTYEALPRVMQAEDWLRLDAREGKRLGYVRLLDDGGSAAALARAGRRTPDVGRADDLARRFAGKAGVRAPQDEQPEFHVTFRLHAPKVVKTNGEVAGGVTTWRWRLEDFEGQAPPQLEAEADLSGPSFLLPVALALGLGVPLLWLRRKWQRRWE